MHRFGVVFVLGVIALTMPLSARADPRYPDWPCAQAKVPELSVGAMWDGPSIEGVGDSWQDDPKLKDLVALAAARKIKSDVETLHQLEDAPNQDRSKVNDLASQVEWSTRIFEDRRKTIRYVCEVPGTIEQRLFALARVIRRNLN